MTTKKKIFLVILITFFSFIGNYNVDIVIYYSTATEPSNRLFMEEMNFVVKNHFSELSVGA
ncbi:MAG: hypothetical protein WB975_07980 [Nitrososphaeraceae archaeon]